MDLKEFYSLRKEFTIIGLTGRTSSGSREVAKFLSNDLSHEDLQNIDLEINEIRKNSINEGLKYRICKNFVTHKDNWSNFKILRYRNVLLMHLFHQGNIEAKNCSSDVVTEIIKLIVEAGSDIENKNERLGSIETSQFIKNELIPILNKNKAIIEKFNYSNSILNEDLKDKNKDQKELSVNFFDSEFEKLAEIFFDLIDKHYPFLRHLLLHDISYNLRSFGKVGYIKNHDGEFKNIYIIAETINRIIKSFRENEGECNIVIDSLKNSLELMYFKEKYSAFYMIASNKKEKFRCESLETKLLDIKNSKFDIIDVKKSILKLDDTEYKINDFKDGKFASSDIENCIQKSDYHIYIMQDGEKTDTGDESFKYITYQLQLIKLVSLIKQPGMITPSALERTMQIAFNSKLNSGCISRQVGAVITDKYYSVKSIGWNEVAEGQTPCSLRSIYDLVDNKNQEIFTKFEKETVIKAYNDETFIDKITQSIGENRIESMNGRNCPFCFKTYHNKFEGKDNQVHTRSLHAEENAMLQIAKYGGQPVKGGNLFTTASPCELCSKKAYQLGIKNIFYIDPYPGIAINQILEGGKNNKPNLFMFQGAVGRGYNKLYETFMSIKDETILRSKIKPIELESLNSKIKTFLDKDLDIYTKESLIEELNKLI